MRIAARLHRIEASPSSMGRQKARELREAGRDVLSLTTGEPDFDTPMHVIEAATRAMKTGDTKYTDPGGTPALKEAVRRKLKRENGLDYTKCWRSAARASRARARSCAEPSAASARG